MKKSIIFNKCWSRVVPIIMLSFLLISCNQSEKKVEMDFSNNVADSTFIQIDTTIHGLKMTSSDSHVYIIDEGKLFAYDKKSKETFFLNQVSYVDDKPYNDFDPIEAKLYFDIVYTDFFQYMDGYLFYTTDYANSEGEEKIQLKSMTIDGQEISVVYEFARYPSKIILTEGYLLYRDSEIGEMFYLNMNTLEESKLSVLDGIENFSYLITNEKTYIIGRGDNAEQFLLELDFNLNELKIVDGPNNGYINFGYDDLILVYDFDDESLINGIIKKIGDEAIFKLENKVLYTIDENFIYTGTYGNPQIYEIYNHDGDLAYSLESPIGFEPLEMFNHQLESSSSGVLGIFNDEMFIMGYRNGQVEYYLVDYKNNNWNLIHTSTHILDVNQYE